MLTGHPPPLPPPCTPPPSDIYPQDIYSLVTFPLDTYPQETYPLGHVPLRTYTPLTLKCPILFMQHVLITYCTLKSIYFAGIAFICDVGTIKLTDICFVSRG